MDTLYGEPAYYRMLFDGRTADLPFYLRHVPERALEIGVGAGRVALALAREGRRVVGVDVSERMLAELEERLAAELPEVRSRVELGRADARTLALGRRFERVILPFNGIAHYLTQEDLQAVLATVRAHLAPGGLFVLDVMIPDPTLLVGGAASTPTFKHPRTGEPCRAEETYAYDTLTQVLTITTSIIERTSGRPPQRLTLGLRQLFPQETLALLSQHGFEVLERDEKLGDTLGYVCRAC